MSGLSVGFTGSRKGMTADQEMRVARWMVFEAGRFPAGGLRVHHGDCVGSDEEFHKLTRALLPGAHITVHPPIDERFRAFCKGDSTWKPKRYYARDRDIVKACDWLLGTPRSQMQPNSDTWYTIGYARMTEVNHRIFFPGGAIQEMEYL